MLQNFPASLVHEMSVKTMPFNNGNDECKEPGKQSSCQEKKSVFSKKAPLFAAIKIWRNLNLVALVASLWLKFRRHKFTIPKGNCREINSYYVNISYRLFWQRCTEEHKAVK